MAVNGKTDGEHFVSVSIIRKVVRAEMQKYASEVIAPGVARAIDALMSEAEERYTEKLEAVTKEFTFRGPWVDGETYRRGNFVTMGGQVYHASYDTKSRPGSDGTWLLAVKSGRDGRDGKD